MVKIKAFLHSINKQLALIVTQHLLMVLGIVATFAFVFSAHWFLVLLCMPMMAGSWFILYKFEEGLLFRKAFTNPVVWNPETQNGFAWKPGLK